MNLLFSLCATYMLAMGGLVQQHPFWLWLGKDRVKSPVRPKGLKGVEQCDE